MSHSVIETADKDISFDIEDPILAIKKYNLEKGDAKWPDFSSSNKSMVSTALDATKSHNTSVEHKGKKKKKSKRSTTPGLTTSSFVSPHSSNATMSIPNSRLSRRMNSMIETHLRIQKNQKKSGKRKSTKAKATLPKYQLNMTQMVPKEFCFSSKQELSFN